MKKSALIIILLLVLVFPILQASKVYSTEANARDKALSFIENVLPIDISQYNVTFAKYHETQMPSLLSVDIASELVTYTLDSEESILDVTCMIKNDVLTYCMVDTKKWSVISDRSYANLIDAAEGFLDKYQTYTGDNLEEMKKTLITVDSIKNMSVTSGNIKLTVSDVKIPNGADQISSSWGIVDHASFSWVYTINGVNYTKLEITYSNGAFFSMSDNRGLYKIGDTSVKVSKEEAISIAINYVKNYSYTMPGGVEISDFNVTEDRTVAELTTSPIESTLYPFWTAMLYLNQTYPGSVYALRVGIWADSGQVFFCNNQAAGGIILEFPSWIILPLFVVATLAVAVARNRLVRKGLE